MTHSPRAALSNTTSSTTVGGHTTTPLIQVSTIRIARIEHGVSRDHISPVPPSIMTCQPTSEHHSLATGRHSIRDQRCRPAILRRRMGGEGRRVQWWEYRQSRRVERRKYRQSCQSGGVVGGRPQPSTLNPQPSTLNPQPFARNQKPQLHCQPVFFARGNPP